MNERLDWIVDHLVVEGPQGYETVPLKTRMEYLHTTAFTLACLKDGKIDFLYSCGTKECDGKEPIDDATPFMAASISKAVFAVGVMKLVQQGVLDLDRDVNEYLKDYRVPADPGLSNRITLRMILGHLAGLNVDGFGGYEIGKPVPTVIQVLRGEPPAKTPPLRVVRPQNTFVPKTAENPTGPYSGGGFVLAMKVVCDVLGRDDFAEIMDELVLRPFGMTHSTFHQSNEPGFAKVYDQRPPTGYNATRGGARLSDYVPIPGGHHVYAELSAGGLWSTSEDLAKFGVKLLEILREDNDPSFRRDTLQQMLVQQPNSENGLGFYIYPTDDPKVFMFAHTGCNDGFMSMAYYFSDGHGMTLMFNSNEGIDFYYSVARSVIHAYGLPVSKV